MEEIIALAREASIDLVAAHDVYYLKQADALARELVNKIKNGRDPEPRFRGGRARFLVHLPRADRITFADIPEAIHNSDQDRETLRSAAHARRVGVPRFPHPRRKFRRPKNCGRWSRRGLMNAACRRQKEKCERMEYKLSDHREKRLFALLSRRRRPFAPAQRAADPHQHSWLRGRLARLVPFGYHDRQSDQNTSIPSNGSSILSAPRPRISTWTSRTTAATISSTYVRGKYGEEKVAQIGTFGTMMARAAVRDVARGLGHPTAWATPSAKLIPFGKQGFPVTIHGAFEAVPDLMTRGTKPKTVAREVLDLAQKDRGQRTARRRTRGRRRHRATE